MCILILVCCLCSYLRTTNELSLKFVKTHRRTLNLDVHSTVHKNARSINDKSLAKSICDFFCKTVFNGTFGTLRNTILKY